MKLFAIVPGFGHPHAEHKENILRSNIALLSKAFPDAFFRVCCYTPGYRLPPDLADAVHAIYEPGIVGHFLLRYAHPEELHALGVTHVAIVLDDVELLPGVDPLLMLGVAKQAGAQVASTVLPSQPEHFWRYMMRDESRPPGMARVCTCCELFFYLMGVQDYARYFTGLDIANPWCWGVDFTLWRVRGLKALLFNDMVARHWYRGSGRDNGAMQDEAAYYAKRGLIKQELLGQQRFEWVQYSVRP